MTLLRLDVFSIRNIQAASLLPSHSLNLIIGANGSGKSSLLEAIFILGRARSFRTAQIKQAIRFEQSQLIVTGQSSHLNGSISHLGIQIDSKQCLIRINQQSRQKADLAYALPVQLMHPKSYRLLDGGPQLRREFLDWGIFNAHSDFLVNWRKYHKALQQRNVLLKSKQTKLLSAWEKELIDYGLRVDFFRREYLARLEPVFLKMVQQFLPGVNFVLRFDCGWDHRQLLEHQLSIDLQKDLRHGFTHSGPHRADLIVLHEQRLAKDYLSRGQQKLLVLALMLAQVDLMNAEQLNSSCILIDDLASELDTGNRSKLLKYLSQMGCQAFLTGNALADFGDLSGIHDFKVFHVEQGNVEAYA